MSLKHVHFDRKALFSLSCHCPAVEYLSLTSCSFEESRLQRVEIFSSSLKTLQIEHCKVYVLGIRSAMNLKSSTFFSSEIDIHAINVNDSYNLKHVCIHAHHLKSLRLYGCHANVKAVLNTPNLLILCTHGYFKSKFYVQAPELLSVEIMFWDLWSGQVRPTFNGRCKRFIAARNFLQQFSCRQQLIIYIRNAKALTFPEKLSRNAFPSPIFPNLKTVELVMSNPPADVRDTAAHVLQLLEDPPPQETEETETSDLSKSLFWLAASPTKITTVKYEHAIANRT